MFLVRSALLLVLLVTILPSEPKEQERFYQTASHAIHQAATFCDRNRTVCTEAAAHWEVFKAKLAIGARMATDLINERIRAGRDEGQPPIVRFEPRPPQRGAPIDTLSPADLAPPWRGQSRTRL